MNSKFLIFQNITKILKTQNLEEKSVYLSVQ